MTRRRFLPCLIALAAAATSPPPFHAHEVQARIELDPDRVIGEVHPHVFGNFVEHLGWCIHDGI